MHNLGTKDTTAMTCGAQHLRARIGVYSGMFVRHTVILSKNIVTSAECYYYFSNNVHFSVQDFQTGQ